MSTGPTLLSRVTLRELRGEELIATTPSESCPGVTHRLMVPLDETQPIRCSATCKARGRHWHIAAGEILRERFRETCDVQSGLTPESLRQQADWLSPKAVGAVSIAYLVSRYLLDKRAEEVAA